MIIWYDNGNSNALMQPHKIDPRYSDLVDQIYDEIGQKIPGFKATMKKMSILVSSPKVQVYYHCDVPGQTLWQVRGSKKVYVNPNREPYLHQPSLEKVVLVAFSDESVFLDFRPFESFDTYLKSLKVKTRKNLRNAHNRLEREHIISHDIVTAPNEMARSHG